MFYPDDYELIQKILQESVQKHGTILVPEYAVYFTGARSEVYMTFSPSNGPHPIVRFWVVRGGTVVNVDSEVVLYELAQHDGYPWFKNPEGGGG